MFREGLQVAVIEAIVSVVPVVATKICGSSDLALQGALFNPKYTHGIAEAIEKMQLCKGKHEAAIFAIHKVMVSMKI